MNPSQRYLMGADGGGSKTAVVLTDLQLRPILCKSFPRSNPGDIGYEATEALLLHAFDEVRKEAGVEQEEIAALFAGVAGLSAGDCTPRMRAALEQAYPHAAVDCSHDGMNVLYAGFPNGEDGVSVICGTGSSCFVRRGDALYRIGGCGQFDLKGNGFEIGRAAFAHVFRTMDGRDEFGWLAKALNDRFEGSCHAHLIEINDFTKNHIASYAPLVFEAAREHDDGEALAILRDQLSYVAELICTAARCFDGAPFSVALAGGIFRDPLTLPLLREGVPPQATLQLLEREPYIGAAATARALLNGAPCLAASQFPAYLQKGTHHS